MIEVELGHWPATAVTLTLSKIDEAPEWINFGYINKDSMVGTITAIDQIKDTERITQMDNRFARSFRDGLHHFHGHEHKFNVDSHFLNV